MALVECDSRGELDIHEAAQYARDQEAEHSRLMAVYREMERNVQELHREKLSLEEADLVAKLQIQKLQQHDRINAAPLDHETRARIQDLRNQHALAKRQAGEKGYGTDTHGINLAVERATAENQYQEKLQRLHQITAELEETKDCTNWDSAAQGPASQRDYNALENQSRELKAALAQIEDEQRIGKELMRKKTDLIEELSGKLLQLRDVELQLTETKEQVKDKQRQKADLAEDLKTLKRIHHKKETLMRDLRHDHEKSDPAAIRRLEADKKVIQHSIQKHAEERRTLDKTIQAQHRRLLALEGRIMTWAAALRTLDLPDKAEFRPGIEPGVDEVDAVLYDQLQRTVAVQRRQLEQAEADLSAADAELEQKDRHLDIELMVAQTRRKMCTQVQREWQREHKFIQHDLQGLCATFWEEADRQQDEKEKYEAAVRTASGTPA
eukprot:TRINITY_DN4167_c1_g1_i1.p1 TRINITY_DN4167_c1_g1~~TRINITY_DN4167_c1_g1_i1.p1  ORF type:complete len:439 (+),score=216.24 TRINITY_DN4167_c1_g1_i1:75-1391(+)